MGRKKQRCSASSPSTLPGPPRLLDEYYLAPQHGSPKCSSLLNIIKKFIYNYMLRPLRSLNKTALHAIQARASPPKGVRGGAGVLKYESKILSRNSNKSKITSMKLLLEVKHSTCKPSVSIRIF